MSDKTVFLVCFSSAAQAKKAVVILRVGMVQREIKMILEAQSSLTKSW